MHESPPLASERIVRLYRKIALQRLFQYDAATMPKHLNPKVGKGPKIKTSIYLNRERIKALKAISDRTLIPMSVLIRKGIDLVIAEYEKSKQGVRVDGQGKSRSTGQQIKNPCLDSSGARSISVIMFYLFRRTLFYAPMPRRSASQTG